MQTDEAFADICKFVRSLRFTSKTALKYWGKNMFTCRYICPFTGGLRGRSLRWKWPHVNAASGKGHTFCWLSILTCCLLVLFALYVFPRVAVCLLFTFGAP